MYKNIKKYSVMICGISTFLFIGLLFSWSIFVVPLEQAQGWDRAQTSMIYTVASVCFSLGLFMHGQIARKKSTLFSAKCGVLLIFIGQFGCSFATSIWTFGLLYGLLYGTGVGICYNVWITTITRQYPDKSNFMAGVLLVGFGFSGLVMGTIVSGMIYSPIGLKNTFRILGCAFVVLNCVTLRHPALSAQATSVKAQVETDEFSLTTSQMLREPVFYLGLLWSSIAFACNGALAGHVAPILQDITPSVAMATVAVGVFSLGSGLGRLAIGAFIDRFGIRRSIFVLVSMLICLALFGYICYTNQQAELMIAVMFLGGFYGGSIAVMSVSFTNTVFGPKYYSSNSGVASISRLPLGLIVPVLVGTIRANTESYANVFVLFLALGLVVAFAAWLCISQLSKMNRKYGVDR